MKVIIHITLTCALDCCYTTLATHQQHISNTLATHQQHLTCALDCCYATCAPQPISVRLGLDPDNKHTIQDLYEISRKQNLSFETLISIPGTHKCCSRVHVSSSSPPHMYPPLITNVSSHVRLSVYVMRSTSLEVPARQNVFSYSHARMRSLIYHTWRSLPKTKPLCYLYRRYIEQHC